MKSQLWTFSQDRLNKASFNLIFRRWRGEDEPRKGFWRRNSPWECCHVCLALSGWCPIVVTVALGVPGGHSPSLHKKKPCGDEGSCHWKSNVRPIQRPGKWVAGHFFSQSWSQRCPLWREEGGWWPLLAQRELATFDPPVEASLPSSQLCLPLSYSSARAKKH